MNLPEGQRFDASGLFLEKSGDLLTESDQQIGVYRIRFHPNSSSVDLERIPDCFTEAQLAPFAKEKFGRYDCEGVTKDDQGRIYLCEEANRWILRWDPQTKKVERLNVDWSPVRNIFPVTATPPGKASPSTARRCIWPTNAKRAGSSSWISTRSK
jgi:hypothetical protein